MHASSYVEITVADIIMKIILVEEKTEKEKKTERELNRTTNLHISMSLPLEKYPQLLTHPT